MAENVQVRIAPEIMETLKEDLNAALSATELHELLAGAPGSAERQQAALHAAVALGYCRMFGVELGEDDGVLPPVVAQAAAQGLVQELERLSRQATKLPQIWDDLQDVLERDELCLSVLEGRMDAQAAYVAIEEGLLEAHGNEEIAWSEYSETIERIVEHLEKLDEILQRREQLEILSTVADLPLLKNWRNALAGEFRFAPYWWLSDDFIQVSEQVERQVIREMPSAEVWRLVAKQWQARNALTFLRGVLLLVFARRVAAAGEPRHLELRWISPDGEHEAMTILTLNDQIPQSIVIQFMRSNGEEARDLVNQPVSLAGIVSYINAQGQAEFAGEQLRQALESKELPQLLVGADRQSWALAPECIEGLLSEVSSDDGETDT